MTREVKAPDLPLGMEIEGWEVDWNYEDRDEYNEEEEEFERSLEDEA